MADFINTLDALGDDAVMGSIINRTITEFKDDTIETVGQYAFGECTALETVYLPNATTLKKYAFYKCTGIITLDLPKVSYIAQGTLDCGVYIKVPSVTAVGAWTMSNGLVKIIDFTAITSIAKNGLINTYKLEALVIRNPTTVCSLGGNDNISFSKAYIYVPRALLSDDDETKDYRRATNWSDFAEKFRALEDYTVDGTTTGELDETKI